MDFIKMFFTSLPASNSATGTLNSNDYVKVIRMAIVAGIGYALTVLAQSATGMDFGPYAPVAQIVLMGIAEVGRRLLSTKPADPEALPDNPTE